MLRIADAFNSGQVEGDRVITEKEDGRPWALIVGILSAVTTYVFIYVSFNEVIAWLGIAGLVIASLLNVFLRQKQLKKTPK